MREPSESKKRTYIAIDLKSFYASVECMERNLDPLTTNLVVADVSRTEKTICLAVSPALKSYGIPGRARLFEVNEKVREVNAKRRSLLQQRYSREFNDVQENKHWTPNGYSEKSSVNLQNGHRMQSGLLEKSGENTGSTGKGQSVFSGKSTNSLELEKNPTLEVSFIAATPQMAKYMKISTKIYSIYLRYIAPEDIHVYSIDEVFMDVTGYLKTYGLTAHDLAIKLIREVLKETGITATAGIGTNLYLAKVAMDIVAKHIPADEDGVRIAELDEMSYRKLLWDHKPLRDFWRVGRGYVQKLQELGLETMGDIARCSLGGPGDYYNEDLLYKTIGVNAELLIDHAWGYEPCSIKDIKAYKPKDNSLGSGQVLMAPYDFQKGKVIVIEMAEELSLSLVDKGLVTDQIVLDIGYDIENLKDDSRRKHYQGQVKTDFYGRRVPKPAHGTENLGKAVSSMEMIRTAAVAIYEREVNPQLYIRRVGITACHVMTEVESRKKERESTAFQQLDLFTDYAMKEKEETEAKEKLEREKRLQSSMLDIRKKFGNNAILRGINFEDGATGRERNKQIGGHKA
jgi:DNA polymerase V